MSISAMSYVWEHSPAKGSQLLTLLAIADSARDPDWVAWPSLKTLMRKTRLGERAVRYILRDLEAAGCLATEIEASAYGTNLYRIVRRRQTLPLPDETGHEDAPAGGNLTQNGGNEDAPNPSVNHQLTQREAIAVEDEDDADLDPLTLRFADQMEELGTDRAAWLARHGIHDYGTWLTVMHLPLGDTAERTWARATRRLKER